MQINLFMKQTHNVEKLMVNKGGCGERDKLGIWD